MPFLREDTFIRRAPGREEPRRRLGTTGFVLLLVAGALLALSRIDHPVIRQARLAIAELVAPALKLVAGPLAPLRNATQEITSWTARREELARLRAEVQELRGWEARARELERRLADLAALARVVDEAKIRFVTARVIADANGPFARSVLVSAGQEQGLKDGYPVISADGLVGRVLESGPSAARVLLLTDLNSRVPVLIGEAGLRGILVGDNGPRPRLAHLPPDARPAPGDRVVTSGVGGLFPRGLRIGTVAADDGGVFRIEIDARLDELDHVSILFHDTAVTDVANEGRRLTPAARARERALARRAAGGGTAGEEKQ